MTTQSFSSECPTAFDTSFMNDAAVAGSKVWFTPDQISF
jgi:hypothetical protein